MSIAITKIINLRAAIKKRRWKLNNFKTFANLSTSIEEAAGLVKDQERLVELLKQMLSIEQIALTETRIEHDRLVKDREKLECA